MFYAVRGQKSKFSRGREISKTRRDKSMDEILKVYVKNKFQNCKQGEGTGAEVFLSRNNKNTRIGFTCKNRVISPHKDHYSPIY